MVGYSWSVGSVDIYLMFGSACLRNLFSRNKRMIAGNWKSNFTATEATNFVKNTIQNIKFNPNNVGMLAYIQMSSSLQCSSTSLPFSPSTPPNSSITESPHKTAPTTAWEPLPEKSAPNTSRISVSSGSSWVTLKGVPSSERKTP